MEKSKYEIEFEKLNNEKFCLAAVQQNGHALQYVKESAQTEEVCLVAVKQNSNVLQYIASLPMLKKMIKKLNIEE